MPQASPFFPRSWYRKDTQREYVLPTDWDTALHWYRDAFSVCGYRPDGSDYSGNCTGIVSRDVSTQGCRYVRKGTAIVARSAPALQDLLARLRQQ